MTRPASPAIELFRFPGLISSRITLHANSPSVRRPASHNDVGLNYVERGWATTLTASGHRYRLETGQLMVFWGAVPHKIESFDPRNIYHSLVLPIGVFLQWSMPVAFTRQLLGGRFFIETDPREAPLDLALLNRWHREIDSGQDEGKKIVLLELEGRLRRLARSSPATRSAAHTQRGTASQAERMLVLIAEHFRKPLLPRDVAAAVGMHPDNAGRLFRERLGLSLTDYIAQCRVSHAKALLATTTAKMVDVALDSGFGSVGHFHLIFKRLAGCTPRAYRMNLRQPARR